MASNLTPQQKLNWLGLKSASQHRTSVQKEVKLLKANVGDYTTYQSHMDEETLYELESFKQHKNYLTSNGFSDKEATAFNDKIKQAFTDTDGSGSVWDEYDKFVVAKTSSWADFKTGFQSTNSITSSTTTDKGDQAAGVRFFEQPGVTKDGAKVPAGTAEVYAREIHFSQTGPTQGSTSDLEIDNLRTDDDDNVLTSGQTVTIGVDVTNRNDHDVTATFTLTENGDAYKSKSVTVKQQDTRLVAFDVTKTEYNCWDYAIENTDPITVCWTPENLTT